MQNSMGYRVGGNSIVNGELFFIFYLIRFRGKTICFFSPLKYKNFLGELRVRVCNSITYVETKRKI